ncbi:unnamed protein product [Gordionus sp. m RMFG-2023]
MRFSISPFIIVVCALRIVGWIMFLYLNNNSCYLILDIFSIAIFTLLTNLAAYSNKQGLLEIYNILPIFLISTMTFCCIGATNSTTIDSQREEMPTLRLEILLTDDGNLGIY